MWRRHGEFSNYVANDLGFAGASGPPVRCLTAWAQLMEALVAERRHPGGPGPVLDGILANTVYRLLLA